MPFTTMQQEYFRNANRRWNVKSGATRSGKTYMDYYLIWQMKMIKKNNIVFVNSKGDIVIDESKYNNISKALRNELKKQNLI